MNQCERILKYLDEHGSITRAEAMSECGIANFTARVSDLRRDGVALDVETVTQKNRYGETVTYKRYRIDMARSVTPIHDMMQETQ